MTHLPIHNRPLFAAVRLSPPPLASESPALAEMERLRRFESEAMPHRTAIQRTARRLAGEAADDVTQEVFLPAWRGFHRFSAGTNCRA